MFLKTYLFPEAVSHSSKKKASIQLLSVGTQDFAINCSVHSSTLMLPLRPKLIKKPFASVAAEKSLEDPLCFKENLIHLMTTSARQTEKKTGREQPNILTEK
jgi:hypothetical protein